MASKYLNSLSSEDRKALTEKLFHIQNGKCYICGQDIDLELQTTNIDHIVPLSTKGKDNEDNFALTHESCNKSKQDANLSIARSLFKLRKIQDEVFQNEHRAASLKDLLIAEGGSKYNFSYKIDGDEIAYTFNERDNEIHRASIFTDELSGEKTCFIYIPIEYLFHDEVINPRGINSSINLLVKEFFKHNPQLHLTLARIDNGKIKVFDGQHKAAAQILLGVKNILVRLFICPDVNKLTETNANAGSKLRQIAFDKSIMRQLNNTLYAERVKEYQEAHGLSSDDFSFSELSLCDYFKGEKNIKKYIIDAIKSSITNSDDNKLRDFIDFEGKQKTLPISHSAYDKTFLAWSINSKYILNTPMNFKSEDGMNPRELEISQVCKLLTIFAETFYIGKFKPEVGTNRIEQRIVDKRDTDITDDHLIAFRISKEEIIMAIMPYIEKVIETFFLVNEIDYIKDSWFQTPFPNTLWNNIRNFFNNLGHLPLWKDRSMAATHFSGKKTSEFWKTIFATGKTPEQVQVLAKRLEHTEMVKPLEST